MSKARRVVEELLDLADVKIDGNRPFDIRVKDKRFYKRVLGDRELGMGESYMDGWWEVDKLDQLICRVLSAGLRDNIRITPEIIRVMATAAILNRQTIKKASLNASHHYNVGNDLYELMLDKRMIYSCAYWKNAKNLDEAQENKLRLICEKLQLEPGMSVLDIGCGWGGFARYAAENYKVSVVGITPAAEQIKLAKRRAQGFNIEIKQQDYRETTGNFDRIVSIGMLEHVGPKNYQMFFERCKTMLNEDGIMLHHTIGGNRSMNSTDPWMDKYIFPGGVLPSLVQITKAVENKLVIEDVHNFGPEYDKTLLAWHANFVANYPKLKSTYDERFYRMWEFYLLASAGMFRARHVQLWQIVMRKIAPSDTYQSVR